MKSSCMNAMCQMYLWLKNYCRATVAMPMFIGFDCWLDWWCNLTAPTNSKMKWESFTHFILHFDLIFSCFFRSLSLSLLLLLTFIWFATEDWYFTEIVAVISHFDILKLIRNTFLSVLQFGNFGISFGNSRIVINAEKVKPVRKMFEKQPILF